MILDLTQFRQDETDLTRRYEPAAFEGRDNPFGLAAPVNLRLKVQKDKDRYRLVGAVSTVLDLTCSRCLEPYQLPVDSRFDVRYLPHAQVAGDAEREVEEDDLSDAYYRDDVIDLGQLMDEQFYLALPMKPLCREDCKGLCASCGADLNAGACQCAPATDARWDALRAARPDSR